MICPKCRRAELAPIGHFRWRCPYIWDDKEFEEKDDELGTSEDIVLDGRMCGFQCGLSFFFDDDSLPFALEVGHPISKLQLSPRAIDLIKSGVLALDDLERAVEIERLPSVKNAQTHEDELEEYNTMMREVVGQSASVHRQLTDGTSYRKNMSGGLLGVKKG